MLILAVAPFGHKLKYDVGVCMYGMKICCSNLGLHDCHVHSKNRGDVVPEIAPFHPLLISLDISREHATYHHNRHTHAVLAPFVGR